MQSLQQLGQFASGGDVDDDKVPHPAFVGRKHDELTVAVTNVEQHVDQRLWVTT